MRVLGLSGIRHRRQWDNRLSGPEHRQGKFAIQVRLPPWHLGTAPPTACRHPRCKHRRQCNHTAGCMICTQTAGRHFRRPYLCPEIHDPGLGIREWMPCNTRRRGNKRLQRDIARRCTLAPRTKARREHRGNELGRAAGILARCSMHQTRDTVRHRRTSRPTRHIARALRRNNIRWYRLWQCTCRFGNCDTECSCHK